MNDRCAHFVWQQSLTFASVLRSFVRPGRAHCEGAPAFLPRGDVQTINVPIRSWDKECMFKNKDGTAISGFISIELYLKLEHCQGRPSAGDLSASAEAEHGFPWMRYLRCFVINMPGISICTKHVVL